MAVTSAIIVADATLSGKTIDWYVTDEGEGDIMVVVRRYIYELPRNVLEHCNEPVDLDPLSNDDLSAAPEYPKAA